MISCNYNGQLALDIDTLALGHYVKSCIIIGHYPDMLRIRDNDAVTRW